MRRRTFALGLIFTTATCGTLYASAFTVTDMNMGTLVAVSGGDQDSDAVVFPTNPLNTTHHAELAGSQATTIYDVLWNDDGGDFDFLFDHTIEDGPVLTEVNSSGTLIFNTHADVMLDYDFDYSFSNLFYPVGIVARINVVRATEQQPAETLVGDLYLGGSGPTNGAGAAGTFISDGHLLLEANNRFRITYRVFLTAGGNSSRIGVGSGSLHYSLTPVPEPATAALFCVAGMAMARRSRR